jgi:hypothetical protein
MLLIGGRKKKNKTINNNTAVKKLKGGYGNCILAPADYNGLNTSAMDVDVNFAKGPNMFSSNQVGGGMSYGFVDGKDISAFGGSYAPMSNTCTGGNLGNNRGGNNFMAGGGRSKKSKKSKKSKRSSNSKKTMKGKKKGSTRRYKKTHKYLQKGCNKK